MKHISKLLFVFALLFTIGLSPLGLKAKKVKFTVDMTGLMIQPAGMHITGDFQTLAGFPGGNFNSGSTPLTREGSTDLYSIVVDIPAFSKYEYKFVNGDQFYEVEFVPIESRVGYNFNDNRWIYIDSLAPDTTMLPPLIFSGNAAAGFRLVRFVVDMQMQSSVSSLGVHVAGDFQNWDPSTMRMYSFVPNIWEHIGFVDTLSPDVEFKYYNGNTLGDEESVPSACATNNNRLQLMPKDTVLPTICYGGCSACPSAAIAGSFAPILKLYPNPSTDHAVLRLENHFEHWTVRVTDLNGRIVSEQNGEGEQAIRFERDQIGQGLFFVTVLTEQGSQSTLKMIFK